MSRRLVSIYADGTRVNLQDIPQPTSILDVKGQAKEGLKKKLGLTDDSFHPKAKDHNDTWISVPTQPSRKINDDDTVADVCPTMSDYLMAVIPSAPAVGSPGNHAPEISLLFSIQPHPDSMDNGVLKLIKDLESKFEVQRKQDAEKAAAQREHDAEKAAAQRKRDAEKVEEQRKQDAEKVEAQRKQDAEKVEAQRKQDAEKVEAQRKQDAERVAAQRKKDAEKAEAQRKKDLSDANKMADEWSRKLELNIKELQNKVTRLEQDASDQKLEAKQKYEATKRYIESLASELDATTDFLAVGDEAGLDRIKRRNLLDRAQALLAISMGLSNDGYFASFQFREALGPSSSLEDRQQLLLKMLDDKKDELPSQVSLLMTKPEALTLLAERFHRVRLDGDQVAHGYRERGWYEGSVSRSVGADKVALTILLDFISLRGQ